MGSNMENVEVKDKRRRTLVIKLGYRGAAFSGFALQPTQRTVAGELKQALETLLRQEVELTCAGRTDAGVHAQAQYVSLEVDTQNCLAYDRLFRGLNALTSDDISIVELLEAPLGFSARFDAAARHYRYRIADGRIRPILTWDSSWWYAGSLDVNLMQEAAHFLIGEHDFKSFCKAQSAIDKPTHRLVKSLTVTRGLEMGEELIHIDICGNAFLHSMVRTITGTLVEVGRGHRSPEWVREVLEACERSAAGQCAPAKGLTFVGVDYPDTKFTQWV